MLFITRETELFILKTIPDLFTWLLLSMCPACFVVLLYLMW